MDKQGFLKKLSYYDHCTTLSPTIEQFILLREAANFATIFDVGEQGQMVEFFLAFSPFEHIAVTIENFKEFFSETFWSDSVEGHSFTGRFGQFAICAQAAEHFCKLSKMQFSKLCESKYKNEHKFTVVTKKGGRYGKK